MKHHAPLAVYLAARYSAKPKVLELSKTLERRGILVTSTWCRRDDNEADVAAHRSLAEAGQIGDIGRQFAEEDMVDIGRADVLALLTCWGASSRGGMYVEAGVAFGQRKLTILVGPRANVFDTLHETEVPGPRELVQALTDRVRWQELGSHQGQRSAVPAAREAADR